MSPFCLKQNAILSAKHCWQHSWLSRLEADYSLPPLPAAFSIAGNIFHCQQHFPLPAAFSIAGNIFHCQQQEGNNNKVRGSAAIWGDNHFPSAHAQRRSRNKSIMDGTPRCSFQSQPFPEQLDFLLFLTSSPAWVPFHCSWLLTTPRGPTSKTNSNHWGDSSGMMMMEKAKQSKRMSHNFLMNWKTKFARIEGDKYQEEENKALIRQESDVLNWYIFNITFIWNLY